MSVPIAYENLKYHRARTGLAILGIAFSVLLIFLQIGLVASVMRSATMLFDQLDFDIALLPSDYCAMHQGGNSIPKAELHVAESFSGVSAAIPLFIQFGQWRNEEGEGGKYQFRRILMLGFPLDRKPFADAELLDKTAALSDDEAILFDTKTRKDFGARELGLLRELQGHRVRIAGHYTMGVGFAADGSVMMSDRAIARIVADGRPMDPQIGLLRLRERDHANVEAIVGELRKKFEPMGLIVASKAELRHREMRYWLLTEPLGLIFMTGIAVAVFVGIAVVSQLLSSDIASHIREYATLKAMGYSNKNLSQVVVQQASVLSVAGFIPAFFGAFGVYAALEHTANIPIEMTAFRAVLVFAMTLSFSVAAALLSVKKVRAADPAELF